jgi:hypothetical protein
MMPQPLPCGESNGRRALRTDGGPGNRASTVNRATRHPPIFGNAIPDRITVICSAIRLVRDPLSARNESELIVRVDALQHNVEAFDAAIWPRDAF